MSILETQKLTMRFGGLTAVNQVDLKVEPGKIFSIIGPNGAGKTTVFNAITGIYEPTDGTIVFEGHQLSRPFNWQVVLACGLIGLLTAIVAVLFGVNVDKLWRAGIKRNYFDRTQPFSYAEAWRDAWGYLNGDLGLERQRSGRWSVVTAEGKETLGVAKNEAEANPLKENFQEMIDLAGSDATLGKRSDQWAVLSADRSRVLASYPSAEQARDKLQTLAEVGREQAAMRRSAWIAFFFGLMFGSAAAYAVWNRSRRTPDVISLGGIARTFQNIRLFKDMTVVENVQVGMNRWFRAGALRTALRTPGLRKDEATGYRRAMELLNFVGLGPQAQQLAKNLPYGDQRRLEIARALATKPRLLLLDEPAAGMNPAETADLMELIHKIRDRGITVLLIEHHMNVVMGISDRIAVLDYGVKIAEGTPAEVKANPKVIEAYLGKEEVA